MSDLVQDYSGLSAICEASVQNSWHMKINSIVFGAGPPQCGENEVLVVTHDDSITMKHLDNDPAGCTLDSAIHCGELPVAQPVLQRIVL